MFAPDPRWALFAAGVIVAVMLATGLRAAWGHGDAEWIMRGPYLDKTDTHCCGPRDCAIISQGEIARIDGGWLHVPTGTKLMDGDKGAYPSIDAQMWRCVRAGELKCIFPGPGL